ncbi:hypothetical protein B4113_3276 [Geobacillus sp. B4113_201601]|nr:hypothetical protein B4113_3276 [Geobacillus sp. B4113_201601]
MNTFFHGYTAPKYSYTKGAEMKRLKMTNDHSWAPRAL